MKLKNLSKVLILVALISKIVCKEVQTSRVLSNRMETLSEENREAIQSMKTQTQISPIPHVMKHKHGVPILEQDLRPEERLFWENYNTVTYFTVQSNHKGFLYVHIAFLLISFIFLYPVYLVLQNVGSNLHLPILMLHCGLVSVGMLCYLNFMRLIEELNLYPGNIYTPMSWVLCFMNILHLALAIISSGYEYIHNNHPNYFAMSDEETYASQTFNMTEFSRNSNDSAEERYDDLPNVNNNSRITNSTMFTLHKNPLRVLYTLKWFRYVINHFGRISFYCLKTLNWVQFFYFFIYLPSGVAVFLLFGKGNNIFNLLAHFIKGGVFVLYGILTLARYCGGWSSKGWAWNHKFISNEEVSQKLWYSIQSSGLFTMEMIEGSLILFYGSTNIFLEHLSNLGKAYSAKDLQHASIAFIYIGCGFCGIITEAKLSTWRLEKAFSNYELHSSTPQKILKATPGYSPNPFPIITIYWTGILMSKHQQSSQLSTEIHEQWGSMFALGCAFRLLTYILMLIVPANRKLKSPSRPLTEILVSFALISGGLIFMESTDPVVHAFEYHGYSSMLTLNVSLGIVALLMGWIMSIFALKDWIIKINMERIGFC